MTTKLSLNMSNVNCRAEPPQIKNCWPRSSKANLSWVRTNDSEWVNREEPSSLLGMKSSLLDLLPRPDSIPRLARATHNCLILLSYPLPSDCPQPGLPLPWSSQQRRADDALLPDALSDAHKQGWSRTSGSWKWSCVLYPCCGFPAGCSPGSQPRSFVLRVWGVGEGLQGAFGSL